MYGGNMFPIIDKRETGINIRKIMDFMVEDHGCDIFQLLK